jgi:hypothetical protein
MILEGLIFSELVRLLVVIIVRLKKFDKYKVIEVASACATRKVGGG